MFEKIKENKKTGIASPLSCTVCGIVFERKYRTTFKDRSKPIQLCSKECSNIHKKNRFLESQKTCVRCGQKKRSKDNFRLLEKSKSFYKRCIQCEEEIAKNIKPKKQIKESLGICWETYQRGLSAENYLKYALRDAKSRAKYLKRDFDIDLNFLISLYKKQNGLCAISKELLTWNSGTGRHKNPYNISIDRIDSSKGYTKENVQIVCYMVNLMKNNMNMNEFISWCVKITGASNARSN